VSGLGWCLDDFTNWRSRRPCMMLKVPFPGIIVIRQRLDFLEGSKRCNIQ